MNIQGKYDELVREKKHEVRANTLQQWKHKISRFVSFLRKAGVTESEEISNLHVLDFRESWTYTDSSLVTHMAALKHFLLELDRPDLAKRCKRPRTTEEGRIRRMPRPYSDAEVLAFRAVVEPKVDLFFRTSIATGLAVCDLVKLKVENLQDGMVVTRRQKTGKRVEIPISPELFAQLQVALPFYSGKLWQTGVTVWSGRIRVAQQKAGIYQFGSLVHRGRDSFVERQLAAGVSVPIIAARLGDLLSTMEVHYTDLLSPKMRAANRAAGVVAV